MPEGYPAQHRHHSPASRPGEVKPALILKLDAAFESNQYQLMQWPPKGAGCAFTVAHRDSGVASPLLEGSLVKVPGSVNDVMRPKKKGIC